MIRSRRLLRSFSFLSLVVAPALQASDAQTLSIDYQQTFQTIEAFGASDAWAIDPAVKRWQHEGNPEAVDMLADLLFDTQEGIGLSAWRFNIGAGSAEQGDESSIPDPYRRAELFVAEPGGEVDASKQAGQVRFLQAAHQRGVETFVAFANSPPHWATKNGLTHPADGAGVGSTNLNPVHRDDFTQFLVRVLQHLRSDAVGVPVNYISPANEPTWHWQDQTQEGSRYNNEDLKALYRSLFGALKAQGLEHAVEIDGPEAPEYRVALDDDLHKDLYGKVYQGGMNKEGEGSFRNYFTEFLGDPQMQSLLGNKVSLHGYFSEQGELQLGPLRDAMMENLSRYSPSPRVWMSEYCVLGGPGDVRDFDGHGFDAEDYHLAEHIARIIHRDFTRLNVTAWFWWLALTPYDYKDGLIQVADDLDAGSVKPSKVFWALGQYSRFIRPGYERVAAPGFDDVHGLMASAYRSPENKRLVVVVVNAGDQSQSLSLEYQNLPAERAVALPKIYKTDATSNLAHSPALLNQGRVTLPAHSIVSLVVDLVADTQ
ncbi:glycoside hydrolase family 30 protein [Halioglobus japonicus]|uniref:Xylanase n=1 Tax=Halioglobus japonicus TaxID=930805 RepID=A0AAP8SN12_9GAMM|nr:glycoside hydrolase [Halioglobus japonicus]PLW86160.1 xylanase [Halioglobus japonicus]